MGNTETCETCKFWQPLKDTRGLCRRYPPHVFTYTTSEFQEWRDSPDIVSDVSSEFPKTDKVEWCGEYKDKENV